MTGRPRSTESKNSVHIRVPDWILERIDAIALEHQVPRSVVVLDAVKRQLRIEAPNIFDRPPNRSTRC
jgi:predicted transcriptional regulator